MTVESAPEATLLKASLNRLAGSGERDVIDRASAALGDLDAAAEFVETVGVDQLELAIAATDDAELESRGRRALDAFERFQRAATGGTERVQHFHRGHGTNLRDGAVDLVR